jgi:hypothetical protein
MTAFAVLCLAVLVISVPRDLFVPAARDVEVWFGIEVHGLLAHLTAPIHWIIFAGAAWAFWTDRRWIVPWAVAISSVAFFLHRVAANEDSSPPRAHA